jgi:hypothetical protein
MSKVILLLVLKIKYFYRTSHKVTTFNFQLCSGRIQRKARFILAFLFIGTLLFNCFQTNKLETPHAFSITISEGRILLHCC